jgi:hypothetical protein
MDAQKRRSQWKWDVIKERAENRRLYLAVYTRKLDGKLDEEGGKILNKLEYKLKFEDIL